MKSYDQTERRFDRKASFSVKLQETESVNNFVKTETNVKNKGQYSVSDDNNTTHGPQLSNISPVSSCSPVNSTLSI